MKKCLLTIIPLIGAAVAIAQQKPQYTQYVFNNFLLNPAVSGIENYIDVKAGYRSQWTGLQGAPVTNFLTINAPLGRNFIEGDAAAFPEDGEDPASRSYRSYYEAAAPHHGIGFMVVSDQAGAISQTNIDVTYAYHLGLAPQLNLALGVSGGFNHIGLNTSAITLGTDFDPAISSGNNSQWKPEAGMGVWLYSSNYYLGASVQQLLQQNLYFSTNNNITEGKTVPHYFFTGAVKLPLSDDMSLMPSVLFKVIKPVPVTYDVNLKLSFKDRFWVGGSYRHNDSFAGLVGFNINSLINVGYSYDVTTSTLNTVSNGSHEIIIGILLNNKYKVTCPQRSF